MGPGGAAVRCRHCEGEFKVGPDGKTIEAGEGGSLAAVGAAVPGRERGAAEPAAEGRSASAKEAGAPEAAATAASAESAASDPSTVARRVLAEFGTELAAAFDEFRKASGGSGNPAPFRDALRERWGIDLTPPRAS